MPRLRTLVRGRSNRRCGSVRTAHGPFGDSGTCQRDSRDERHRDATRRGAVLVTGSGAGRAAGTGGAKTSESPRTATGERRTWPASFVCRGFGATVASGGPDEEPNFVRGYTPPVPR